MTTITPWEERPLDAPDLELHEIEANNMLAEIAELRAFKERVEKQEPFAWAIQPHGGPVGLTRSKPTAEQFGGVPLYALPPLPVNAELVEAAEKLLQHWDARHLFATQIAADNLRTALSTAQAKPALTQAQLDADIEYWRKKYQDLDKLCDELEKETSEQADGLRRVLSAVQEYLPPDGIGKDELINRVISIVDPGPLPKTGATAIYDMHSVLDRLRFKLDEFTDGGTTYKATFSQLQSLYDEGRAKAAQPEPAQPEQGERAAEMFDDVVSWCESNGIPLEPDQIDSLVSTLLQSSQPEPAGEVHDDNDHEFWFNVCEGLDAAKSKSATQGMSIGQRIAHVGGIVTDSQRVEFGSPMAVKAFANQLLQDYARAAIAQSKQVPLSDERIRDIGSAVYCDLDRERDDFQVCFVRAIEAAHGIGAAPQAAQPGGGI